MHEYNGVKGLKAIALANNVSYHRLRKVVSVMSLEDAINKKQKRRTVTYEGVRGVPNLAAKYGKSKSGIYGLLEAGATIEEAIHYANPVVSPEEKKRRIALRQLREQQAKPVKAKPELTSTQRVAFGI